ncbi:MAG: NAD(P)H-hydrate dehydratase [Nitrososphaeraceae archaeon]
MYKKIEINDNKVSRMIHNRDEKSRKGDNGIVLIVGGNRLYHGAPILASMSAYRTGVDLVYTAVPKTNVIVTRTYSPNFIVIPLVDEKLTIGSSNRLIANLPKKINSAAIGMGMSITKKDALINLVKKLIEKDVKIVLDASSLIPEILPVITETPTIITPHGGEYVRIFDLKLKSDLDQQVKEVHKLAEKFKITIILKGWQNIISNGEQVAVIKRTTPSMSVGGTGDILAGLVAGFMTKMKPFDASCLGIFLNGKAAELTEKKLGSNILATDILNMFPEIMKKYYKKTNKKIVNTS